MPTQPKKRALVLMGAGASIEFGAPSTAGLTEAIGKKVAADGWMQDCASDVAWSEISDTLAGYFQGGAAVVNFEHIYHCAHELLSIFEPVAGAVNEYRPVLVPFLEPRTTFDQRALKALVQCMAEFIFEELTVVCERQATSLTPLTAFIRKLQGDYITRIYTTNYDDFVLQAAPDLYTGFDPASNLGGTSFDRRAFQGGFDHDCILHRHGSVHLAFGRPPAPDADLGDLFWYDDRAEALKNSSHSGSGKRRMDGGETVRTAVITGLDKLSSLQQQPFSHYYASMARDAMAADIIYLIGCGLSDLHLNTWLGEARRMNPKPPLIFVDRWHNGFLRHAEYDLDRKIIEMIHTLHMPVKDYGCTTYGTGWSLDKNRTYAVWDKGFLGFLNGPGELDHILGKLAQ